MMTFESHDARVGTPAPRLDLDWAGAEREIAETETYLVSTVRPDSTPHVVPVLALWMDDRLIFNTDPDSRKARNLDVNPAISVAAPGTDYDFTIEGTAHRVTDEDELRRFAELVPIKYPWWHPTVRDGSFITADGGTPRSVIAVHPRQINGFGKADGFTATTWTPAQTP